jgi:hypothetical protein
MNTFFKRLFGIKSENAEPIQKEEVSAVCCSDKVHIAYRGISDDRLYICYERQWREVKYFKPHGLRIFCAICRNRIDLQF